MKVDKNDALCGIFDKYKEKTFDFCMCNPPFYDNQTELPYTSVRPGRPEPHSATVAKTTEVSAEGGELVFVSRIIEDSVKLRNKIK